MRQYLLKQPQLPTSAPYRWALATVMITVIALGWKYPLLGFIVPAAMLTGMIGGMIRGRYVCGNLCPRGSFFDTFFQKFGPSREIPEFFYSLKLRWPVAIGLMSFMTWRLSLNPTSINHWGLVFWQMCLVTTAVALVIGMIYRPRTWCTICPVGTIGKVTGGNKRVLGIESSCRQCNLCEQSCPMGHSISRYKDQGRIENGDCLQCGNCIQVCPVSALSLQRASFQSRTISQHSANRAPSPEKKQAA